MKLNSTKIGKITNTKKNREQVKVFSTKIGKIIMKYNTTQISVDVKSILPFVYKGRIRLRVIHRFLLPCPCLKNR